MKFAVGYQIRKYGELFSDIIADYQTSIAEVYFAFPGFASGRPDDGVIQDDTVDQILYELNRFRQMDIKLDLLLNGNCYGELAVSEQFKKNIYKLIDYLGDQELLPEIVTTTSPFVAKMIKAAYPSIELRASVNMRIDSLLALEYLADVFDSFYLRRDLQRDLSTVERFAVWSRMHGKKLCLLANSGCLRNCPYQTFHDNLVAHDSGVRKLNNVKNFMPHLCWERYKTQHDVTDFLRSSWLRPEDVKKYASYTDLMKLATRQHSNPRMVISSYCRGDFDGNMLDLTEPCFSEVFAPQILDNKLLDNIELPGLCAINCNHCGKCDVIAQKAMRKIF